MFLRWKRRRLRRHQDTAYTAVLVRSVWRHGAPRQQIIGSLGTIRASACLAPDACATFWQHVARRLTALALDAATRHAIETRLAQVVPRPPGMALERAHDPRPQQALVPMAPPTARTAGGTRPSRSPQRRPGGLYVRWKRRHLRRRAEVAWDAVLVRCVWQQGTARQRVVAYLASIRAAHRTAPAHRAWFWARVDPRLAALALDPATRHAVEARLARVVPRPTAEELEAVATQQRLLAQWAAETPSLSHPPRAHATATWPDDRHETRPTAGGNDD